MKHWEAHPEPVEGCFGCKGLTLHMNAGDADSRRSMPNKAFNKEISAYKEARSLGIQPAGTSMNKIQEAIKASETLGRAYDAGKMPPAKAINNKTAAIMKEVGI
jgi:hypothetical protein